MSARRSSSEARGSRLCLSFSSFPARASASSLSMRRRDSTLAWTSVSSWATWASSFASWRARSSSSLSPLRQSFRSSVSSKSLCNCWDFRSSIFFSRREKPSRTLRLLSAARAASARFSCTVPSQLVPTRALPAPVGQFLVPNVNQGGEVFLLAQCVGVQPGCFFVPVLELDELAPVVEPGQLPGLFPEFPVADGGLGLTLQGVFRPANLADDILEPDKG